MVLVVRYGVVCVCVWVVIWSGLCLIFRFVLGLGFGFEWVFEFVLVWGFGLVWFCGYVFDFMFGFCMVVLDVLFCFVNCWVGCGFWVLDMDGGFGWLFVDLIIVIVVFCGCVLDSLGFGFWWMFLFACG